MEQREVKRLAIEFPVEFVVLGQESGRQPGIVRDISNEGMRLTTNTVIETGSFLRIEIEGVVFFGEVKYCHPWMGGSIAGLYIEQVLLSDSELCRLKSLISRHANQRVREAV